MGNNLCRERIARADNSKSPIDRIIGRCAQICPSNEGKSNYWEKHVLEKGPTRSQPQLDDGWRKVTLGVPNGKSNNDMNVGGEAPVAPPRRKRSTVIDRQPCGFKELFGNNVSRRSSCDSILKDDNPLTEREQEVLQQKRKSKSISDFNLYEPADSLSISTIRIPVTRTLSLMERAMVQPNSMPIIRPTLQRKISRVGNKKSDKFFGENLSDCLSDEPITPDPEPTSISFTYHTISTLITPISHASTDAKDKLDDFIASNVNVSKENETNSKDDTDANQTSVPKPIGSERKSCLDKKAEFLMAMLEGNCTSTPTDDSKVITPPRRSHLKKRNSQSSSDKLNNQENVVEKKSIAINNNEVKDKIEINDNNNNNNDVDRYKGMTPVDEPIIIPRSRPIKPHICDDDHHHHYHHHNHKHIEQNHASVNENKENQPQQPLLTDEDIEKYIIMQVTNPPIKPKRDASVYEKSNQLIKSENSTSEKINQAANEPIVSEQLPRVRHLSQENLMKKKILANKSNDIIDLMHIKSMQRANKNNINFDKFIAEDGLETVLKKYSSQQSFFTHELLSQIADRVYGLQDPFDTHYGDDGSSNCTPNSKLRTRKVSAHRKESTTTRPHLEQVLEISAITNAPKIVQMEAKHINANDTEPLKNGHTHDNIKKNEEVKIIPTNKEIQVEVQDKQLAINNVCEKRNTENFISIERENSIVCDKAIVNGIVEKDVSLQLADLPTKTNDAIKIEPASNQIDIKLAENHVLDDIYKKNNTILGEFQKNFNGNISIEQNNKVCDKLENLNSSDDDNSDSDITVKEVLDVVKENEIPSFAHLNGGTKRGSIVEVDSWFLKHNQLSEHPMNMGRRDSESSIGYNTRKVFPFGKSDSGAGSDFFESKSVSKSAEDLLNGNITKVDWVSQQNGNVKEIPSTNDHSILLKYLK